MFFEAFNVIVFCIFCLFQRATLAEKEVSALKEQLAVANNQPHSDTQKVSAPNSDDLTPHRPSLEIELSAKDKEVRFDYSYTVPVVSFMPKGSSRNLPSRLRAFERRFEIKAICIFIFSRGFFAISPRAHT